MVRTNKVREADMVHEVPQVGAVTTMTGGKDRATERHEAVIIVTEVGAPEWCIKFRAWGGRELSDVTDNNCRATGKCDKKRHESVVEMPKTGRHGSCMGWGAAVLRRQPERATMNAPTTTTKPRAIETSIIGDYLTITTEAGTISINPTGLLPNVVQAALMHGLKQKICDAAAISRNPDTGRSASIWDKFSAMTEVADRLKAGNWNKPAEGPSGPKGGLLFAALCRRSPEKNPEALRVWLEGFDDAQKAALRANPKIATIIAEIKAERDAAKVDGSGIDSDELLDGLNDI